MISLKTPLKGLNPPCTSLMCNNNWISSAGNQSFPLSLTNRLITYLEYIQFCQLQYRPFAPEFVLGGIIIFIIVFHERLYMMEFRSHLNTNIYRNNMIFSSVIFRNFLLREHPFKIKWGGGGGGFFFTKFVNRIVFPWMFPNNSLIMFINWFFLIIVI